MPYVDPMPTYVDGELIPTSEINDWIGNIDYLHSRPITLTAQGVSNNGLSIQGDYAARGTNNVSTGDHMVFGLAIPDNYATLLSAQIVIFSTTSYTAEYDVNVDFGEPNAAVPENYNQHSASIPDQTIALTANKMKYIDISAALVDLAAKDVLSVRISNSTGANAGTWYAPILKIVYTPSDTVP